MSFQDLKICFTRKKLIQALQILCESQSRIIENEQAIRAEAASDMVVALFDVDPIRLTETTVALIVSDSVFPANWGEELLGWLEAQTRKQT